MPGLQEVTEDGCITWHLLRSSKCHVMQPSSVSCTYMHTLLVDVKYLKEFKGHAHEHFCHKGCLVYDRTIDLDYNCYERNEITGRLKWAGVVVKGLSPAANE